MRLELTDKQRLAWLYMKVHGMSAREASIYLKVRHRETAARLYKRACEVIEPLRQMCANTGGDPRIFDTLLARNMLFAPSHNDPAVKLSIAG